MFSEKSGPPRKAGPTRAPQEHSQEWAVPLCRIVLESALSVFRCFDRARADAVEAFWDSPEGLSGFRRHAALELRVATGDDGRGLVFHVNVRIDAVAFDDVLAC